MRLTKNIFSYFSHIYNFITKDIWRITEIELSRTPRFFYRLYKIIYLSIRGVITENLPIRSSALSYSVLFAIIPLFALIIAISKGFGIETYIANYLEESIIGDMDMTSTVMGFVDRYLATTQQGLFIGVGLLILFWSVMNFFRQIERAFNSIWQINKVRSLTSQFTTYFSSIMIIPILIVFSAGFSIFISKSVQQTYIYDVLSPLLRFGVKLIPYIINIFVFSILYMVIPNIKVRFANAFTGGFIAGTAFQAFQMLYINGQVYLSRYNVVYGSFAAIPLLLMWLQISSLILLFGSEISYVSQNVKYFDYEEDTNHISIRYKNFLTVFIVYLIVKRFELGKQALTSEDISTNYRLPIRIVKRVIDNLVEVRILNEIKNEIGNSSYTPALDINQLTVNLLFSRIENKGSMLFLKNKSKDLDEFWEKTQSILDTNEQQTGQILIKDITNFCSSEGDSL